MTFGRRRLSHSFRDWLFNLTNPNESQKQTEGIGRSGLHTEDQRRKKGQTKRGWWIVIGGCLLVPYLLSFCVCHQIEMRLLCIHWLVCQSLQLQLLISLQSNVYLSSHLDLTDRQHAGNVESITFIWEKTAQPEKDDLSQWDMSAVLFDFLLTSLFF